MLLREYKSYDADIILTWIDNERELRLWSADRYGDYPVTSEDVNNNYDECKSVSNFYPLTLEDDGKVIGHLILRNPGEDTSVIRLGFIMVDKSIRGKGYGKKLIEEAINYAKEVFNPSEINLGVFVDNDNALNCYKAAGFEIDHIDENVYKFKDESWDCAEMILRK